MSQVKIVYNRMGWYFCVLLGIMIVMQVPFMILGILMKIDVQKNMDFLLGMSAVSYYVVGFPMFALCMNTIDGKGKQEKSSLSLVSFVKFFLVSFALMLLTNLINIGFYGLFQLVTGHEMKSNLDGTITGLSFVMVLTTVVLAPVFEELTFRYLALNKLRKFGDKTAILVTAVLFGMFHMNFEQAIYAFAIGLVFGYVACRTGRVIYTIILHAMVNFCGGVLPLLVENSNKAIVNIMYYVIIFVLILAGVVILLWDFKKIKLNRGDIVVEKPVKSFFTSPGMLVFVIGCTVFMLLSFVVQIGKAFL